MDKFTTFTAAACPIDQSNVNTDQILPARYLKWTRAQGIGKVLFNDLRFRASGEENPDFPLNRPQWRNTKIVVAARNFGCGSSREAAVYALYDYGIRCVIAPSFGDIFAGNSVQNGLLTAAVTDDEAAEMIAGLDCSGRHCWSLSIWSNRRSSAATGPTALPSIRCGACVCSTAGTIST